MNNLQQKINVLKGEQYGYKTKYTLTSVEQSTIFNTTNITNENVLNKLVELLNYVVDSTKTYPIVYDENALSTILSARWKPNVDDNRKAYDAINKSNGRAEQATINLRNVVYLTPTQQREQDQLKSLVKKRVGNKIPGSIEEVERFTTWWTKENATTIITYYQGYYWVFLGMIDKEPNNYGRVQDSEIFVFPTDPTYQGSYGIYATKREKHN